MVRGLTPRYCAVLRKNARFCRIYTLTPQPSASKGRTLSNGAARDGAQRGRGSEAIGIDRRLRQTPTGTGNHAPTATESST
jgi:hypothetical protein